MLPAQQANFKLTSCGSICEYNMCNRTHDGQVVCVMLGCRALLTGEEGLHRLKDAENLQSRRHDLLEPPSDA